MTVDSSALEFLFSQELCTCSSRWNKCQALCSNDAVDVWTEFKIIV